MLDQTRLRRGAPGWLSWQNVTLDLRVMSQAPCWAQVTLKKERERKRVQRHRCIEKRADGDIPKC